ncbi:MAG TPA: hypothetical protein VF254_10280, partial [Gammaproteobacteria bacterium]
GFTDITGTAGADTFTLSGTGNISGTISGGGGTDTLTGNNLVNAWTISGANAGSLTDTNGSSDFTGIATLTGGTNDDTFTLTTGTASFNGSIAGGGGTDTLAATDGTNAWTISSANAGTMNTTTTFSAISNLDGGSGTDTLTGANAATAWSLTGANAVTVASMDATSMNALVGGTNDDTFTLTTGTASFNGSLAGGGGTDTVAATDGTNAWTISGANAGTLNGTTTFSGIADLTGGSAGDTFTLATTITTFNGGIAGGGGTDTLAATDGTNAWTISGANAGDLNTTTTFSAIDSLTGGSGSDALTGANDANTWTIDGADSGNVDSAVDFTNMENLTGGTADDDFVFGAAGSLSGLIDGATHTSGDSVDYSALGTTTATIGTDFVNIESIAMGTGSVLTGGTNWTITGLDSGTVDGLAFSGVQNIDGTASDESFTLDGGTLTGSIDGAGGNDTLTADGVTNTWTLTGTNAGNVSGVGGGFVAIENLNGGDSADTFNLDFDVTGTVNGGLGSDTFNYTDGVSIGTLTGGGGTDTLVGGNVANTWTLSGANSGTLNTQSYASMEDLTGNANTDDFVFSGGSVSGDIDGAGGSDTLDYSALAGPVSVDLANSTATNVTGTFSNIENLDGSAGSDTLTGANGANTWTLNANNGGDVNGFAFTSVENLSGGTGGDTFAFSTGSVSGDINGGAGTDVLDYSAATGPVTVNLQSSTANGIGGTFGSVESLVGSAFGDTVIGAADANAWTITAADTGNIDGTFAFAGVENLTGGAAVDTFTLSGGTLTGAINGGGGSDLLTGSNTGSAFVVTGTNSGTVTGVTGGFASVENLAGGSGSDTFTLNGGTLAGAVTGGGGTDTLTGDSVANTFTVTGADSGTATGVTGGFSAIENLIGNAQSDSFVLSGGTLSGTMNGAGGIDTLAADDAVANTWTLTAANAGNVTGTGSFTSMENLGGGDSTDTFNLAFNVTGTVNGGLGSDTFNYTDGVSIGTLTGGGGTDTLVGGNVANTWTLSGANSGMLNTQSYASMEDLTGNANTDDFVFSGGSVSGDIDGAGGSDTLDYSGLAGPVTIDLQSNSASSIGGTFASIENFAGSAGSDMLRGSDGANTWTVTADNAGDVNGFAFSGIENLGGGTSTDTFNLGAGVSGVMNGGAGSDTFNIVGSFTAPGTTLTLIGETVSNAGAFIIGGTRLVISGANTIGSGTNALLTDMSDVSLNATGDVFLTDSGALTLTAVSVGGDLTLETSDDLIDAGAVTVTGVTMLDANGGDIDLASAGNDFGGAVTINGGNVSLTDMNDIVLGASTVSGNLVLTADGVTQSGALTVTGTSDINSAGFAVTLTETANDFGGAVSVDGTNVSLIDTDDIVLGASTATGSLMVTAAGITVSGIVTAGAAFTGNSSGDLVIGSTIDAGSVDLDATGVLAVNDGIDSAGGISIDANGTTTIAASGDINAGGAVNFGANRAGSVQAAGNIITTGDAVTFHRALTLTGTVSIDTSDGGAVATGGNVNFAGTVGGANALTVEAGSGGDVVFNQAVNIGALDVSADQVTFNNDLTTTGSVGIDNGGLLTLSNARTLDLGGSFTQTGAGNVNLGSDITTSGDDVVFAGAVTLTDNVVMNTGTAANIRFQDTVAGGGNNLTANAATAGAVRFDAVVSNANDLAVIGSADVNADIGAASLAFGGDVDLAGNVDLISSGSIAVNGGLSLSGAASSTSRIENGGDAAISIGAITSTNGQSLTLRSEGNMTLGTADLNGGTLTAEVDSDDDDVGTPGASARTLTAASLVAGDVMLEGGADNNDRFDIGTVTSTSGDVVIANTIVLAGSMDIASADDVTFSNAISSTGGAALNVNNTGTLTVGGTLNLGGAFTQAGGAVNLDGDITTSGDAVTLAGAVDIGGATRGIDTGTGAITLGAVSGSGTLDLDGSGTFTAGGDISVGTLDVSGMSGRMDVDGAVAITTADTGLVLDSFASIEAAAGGGSLALDAGSAQVILPTTGGTAALDSLLVNGSVIRVRDVTTTGDQAYSAAQVNFSGTQAAGAGDIDVDGAINLLANTAMSGADITLDGDVNGGFTLGVAGTGAVSVNGDAGTTTVLAGLDISGATASIDNVITSGAQRYDAATTVNGDLTGGGITFTQEVHFAGNTLVESDTIDFQGATGSVTGGGELTLIPLTDGADIDLGGTSGTLDLDTGALEGYDAGLVIGGIVTADSITTRAGHVTVDGDFSVGENGYLTVVSRSGVTLLAGTVSGDTLTLIAADPSGSITNGAANAASSLLQGNSVILVAGGVIGADLRDINVISLDQLGTLEAAWGAGEADAYVNRIGNSLVESPSRPRALAIARNLGLQINANQSITSSAQNSANREQSGGLANEGFIDPSLFEDIALYEVSGTGIALPADQSEEEVFDSGPSMDCNTDDESCDMQDSPGAVGVTSPQ